MIRKIIYNLIVIFILLAMMGCSMSNILPEQQEESPHIEVEGGSDVPSQPILPTEGGQLKIPISQPDIINPLLTKSKDFINLLGLIYEGLFAYDENLNLVPILAESWEVSDEGKRWEFHLRKGIKWHNGNELTAEDVKYTFDLLFDEIEQLEEGEVGSLYAQRLFNGKDIVRMEFLINNPYAVAIVLDEPVGRTLMDALTFPVLPKGALDQDSDISQINSLIGTGPYKVESGNLDIGSQIKLVRNDGWWGSPQPYIDSIVANIYKDNEESLEAFKKGEVDLVDTHVIYAESYVMNREMRLYRYLTQNYDYIGINHKNPGVLGDRRVREAIAYAMDRKDIVSRVYANNAQAVDVPIPPDSWYYDSDLRVFDYQPLKAQQILEEAGWTDSDDDGIMDKHGGGGRIDLSFTINANMDSNMQKEALNLIVEQLGGVGIDVKLRLLPWDDYMKALEEGDFEAVLGEYYLDLSSDLRLMFHSSDVFNGLNNYMGYASDELDQLLDKVAQIEEPQEFVDTYKKIQKHLIEELPIVSLYYRTSSLITSERVHGIKAPRELMIFRDIKEWYLSQ